MKTQRYTFTLKYDMTWVNINHIYFYTRHHLPTIHPMKIFLIYKLIIISYFLNISLVDIFLTLGLWVLYFDYKNTLLTLGILTGLHLQVAIIVSSPVPNPISISSAVNPVQFFLYSFYIISFKTSILCNFTNAK